MKLTDIEKRAIESAAHYYFGLNDDSDEKTVCTATAFLSSVLEMATKIEYGDELIMNEIEIGSLKSSEDIISFIEEDKGDYQHPDEIKIQFV